MIYLETGDLYYNTQVYFRKNLMDDLPNDDKAWREAYHTWLETQGAVIIISPLDLIRNVLGVAPSYDKFGFKNESDATLFVLKWS
jgi:hypothetical protein